VSSRLFQVLMLWQVMPIDALGLADIRTELYQPAEDDVVLMRNPLELKLELIETPTGLDGILSYKTSLFSGTEVDALIGALTRGLARAAADPAITVAAFCQALRD
jgi:hypothetical protein